MRSYLVQNPIKILHHNKKKEIKPELGTSELCTTEQISQYKSVIGSLQWKLTIGRFDIDTAVVTMSGFHIAPRVGHLDRL
jgi:hypothetical protein